MSGLSSEILLEAYAQGVFPMAESAEDDDVFWVVPEQRGMLPLNQFHVTRRLKRTIRSDCFEVRVDHDFSAVIAGCAEKVENRKTTWINEVIHHAYVQLFFAGHGHSVEVYDQGKLAGGLYGIHLGGAFFGESMFHRSRDASKVALAYLVGRLKVGGFTLLDTQFLTDHLKQFGAIEIPQEKYLEYLDEALAVSANWWTMGEKVSGGELLGMLEN